MIIREFKDVQVVSFATGTDDYGFKRKKGQSSRTVKMVIKNYSAQNTADARYLEATDIGLTYDKEINDTNQIIIDGLTYDVLYVIPSNRLQQVLIKRVK